MPEFVSALTWMRDDKFLLFAKGRRDLIDQPHEIWKINVENGQMQNLGMKSEYVIEIRVHPDNHRVVIATQTDTSEIWVMENFLPAKAGGP